MGAADFRNHVSKKTYPKAEDAFRAAVQQAQYDHGHSGYTGTIAEKGDFVMLEVPPGLSVETFIQTCMGGWSYEKEDIAVTERREFASEEEAKAASWNGAFWLSEPGKWQAEVMVDVDPATKAALRRAYDAIDDKWGPAGCVETDTEWVFFGWASE